MHSDIILTLCVLLCVKLQNYMFVSPPHEKKEKKIITKKNHYDNHEN